MKDGSTIGRMIRFRVVLTVTGGVGAEPERSEIWRVPVEKTLFFAGEATDITGHNGTVHGAIASGRRAASRDIAQSPVGNQQEFTKPRRGFTLEQWQKY